MQKGLNIVVIIVSLCSFMIGFFFKNNWSYISNKSVFIVEVCENARDDDGDGLIDLNDPDCECQIIEPKSLIPNPSFEDMNCCPDDRSQLNCAEVWIQASEPTTDFIHTCGWKGWDQFPAPFPFPDGMGIMGFRDGRVTQNNPQTNWKEYAGACLLEPLLKNTTYRFEFYVGFVNSVVSPPINITFFGTSDCVNLPFGVGDQQLGCPTNGPDWVELGSSVVTGRNNSWIKTSIVVTPTVDIAAIAIGPECRATSANVSTYYFFDNLILADLESFEFQVIGVFHPCSEEFYLEVPDEFGISYQWYKNGIALIGETRSQLLNIQGEGNYQVRLISGDICKVTKGFYHTTTIFGNPVEYTICKEDVYAFGDRQLSNPGFYIDTIKSVNNCDSVATLTLRKLGILADTVTAKIFEGEKYKIGNNDFRDEGDHLATLVSIQGCDSLVLLQLEYYNVYTPNVFSPNGDGQNDIFTILGDDELIEVQMTIYDRWGSQIYNGSSWNGKSGTNNSLPGLYIYVAKIIMNDGKERQMHGSVTLVK